MNNDDIVTSVALALLIVAAILIITGPKQPRRAHKPRITGRWQRRLFGLGALLGVAPLVLIWLAGFDSHTPGNGLTLLALAGMSWLGILLLALLFFVLDSGESSAAGGSSASRSIGNGLLTLFLITPLLGALGMVILLLAGR